MRRSQEILQELAETDLESKARALAIEYVRARKVEAVQYTSGDLKNFICKNCNHLNQLTPWQAGRLKYVFCSNCGKGLQYAELASEPAVERCGTCGSIIPKHAIGCMLCRSSTKVSSSNPKTYKCSNCGTLNQLTPYDLARMDNRFCSSCSRPLRISEPVPLITCMPSDPPSKSEREEFLKKTVNDKLTALYDAIHGIPTIPSWPRWCPQCSTYFKSTRPREYDDIHVFCGHLVHGKS